jgi:hypothetical protein
MCVTGARWQAWPGGVSRPSATPAISSKGFLLNTSPTDRWCRLKESRLEDPVARRMLGDQRSALGVVLDHCGELGLTGRVIRIGPAVEAFTLGFELNPETLCVLFEFTNLEIKGLAAHIFRQFCREMEGCSLVNIMDDCGLESLRQMKLSYHPVAQRGMYNARAKTG